MASSRAIHQDSKFVRDSSLDFSDDGNRFAGYRYRGLPCSYLRADDDIYLSLSASDALLEVIRDKHLSDELHKWVYGLDFDTKYNDSANGVAVRSFSQDKWEEENDKLIDKLIFTISECHIDGSDILLSEFQRITYSNEISVPRHESPEQHDMRRITDYPWSFYKDDGHKIISILERCGNEKLARRAKLCYDWNMENNPELRDPKMISIFRKELYRVLDKAGLDSYKILDGYTR